MVKEYANQAGLSGFGKSSLKPTHTHRISNRSRAMVILIRDLNPKKESDAIFHNHAHQASEIPRLSSWKAMFAQHTAKKSSASQGFLKVTG